MPIPRVTACCVWDVDLFYIVKRVLDSLIFFSNAMILNELNIVIALEFSHKIQKKIPNTPHLNSSFKWRTGCSLYLCFAFLKPGVEMVNDLFIFMAICKKL